MGENLFKNVVLYQRMLQMNNQTEATNSKKSVSLVQRKMVHNLKQ